MSQNWPGQPQQPPQPGQPYPGYPQGQYPQQYAAPYSPYQMPQVHPMVYAQAEQARLMGSFARAATMLFVTGGLFGLCGMGCVGLGAAAPWDQVLSQMMSQMGDVDPNVRQMMTVDFIRGIFIALGIGHFAYGVLAIVLGAFVRRGSGAATVTATIVTGLLLVGGLLLMCGGFAPGGAKGRPQDAVLGLCMMLVPMALLAWQLIWLIQAARSRSALRAAQGQMQMQMQYWQMMAMQQQQQQYQQMMGQKSEIRNQNSEEKRPGGEGGGQG